MPSTTRFGIATPADTDLVTNGASAIRTVANGFDAATAGYSSGTFAARPAAAKPGRFYLATDDLRSGPHGTVYFDDGTEWVLTSSQYSAGTLASRPAAGIAGRLYLAINDTTSGGGGTLYFDTSSAWVIVQIGPATAVASSVDSIFKPGDLKMTAKAAADSGWLLCDGSAVSRSTYAALLAAIGTAFGSGNGTTTFNVPDLRGRVPVGPDGTAGRLSANDALGQTGGAETHAHTAGSLAGASHSHTIGADGDHTHGMGTATRGTPNGYSSNSANESVAFTNHVHGIDSAGSHSHGGATGASGAVTVSGTTASGSGMQPYQVVNYVIKT
jgi:microcystin-dependent protein